MFEETSDTVLAFHAKSRKFFCLIDFGMPNNNLEEKKGRERANQIIFSYIHNI